MKIILPIIILLISFRSSGQDLKLSGIKTIVTNKNPQTGIKQNITNEGGGNYFKLVFYNDASSTSTIEVNSTLINFTKPVLYKTVEQSDGPLKPTFILYRYRCNNPEYGEFDFYIVRKKKKKEFLYAGVDFYNQNQMFTLFPNKIETDNLKN
jgi:hypothetical protein